MKKNTGSFFAAVFLLLLLCGCGPELIALNETHNGQIIDCSKGDIVEIRLPGNPTTGYVWQQSRRPVNDVVVLKQEKFTEKDSTRQMVGVPGTFFFRYEITGRGKEGISLQYKRPWDANSTTGKFEILLNVD